MNHCDLPGEVSQSAIAASAPFKQRNPDPETVSINKKSFQSHGSMLVLTVPWAFSLGAMFSYSHLSMGSAVHARLWDVPADI